MSYTCKQQFKTGLNLTSLLHEQRILEKFNVKVIGVQVDVIKRGEDRISFKETMDQVGVEMAKSNAAHTLKEAIFPFNMFPEVDPLLGPEMRSTGEVLAMADSFPQAFFKAQEAVQQTLPTQRSLHYNNRRRYSSCRRH